MLKSEDAPVWITTCSGKTAEPKSLPSSEEDRQDGGYKSSTERPPEYLRTYRQTPRLLLLVASDNQSPMAPQ